jgi:hypothetical protein
MLAPNVTIGFLKRLVPQKRGPVDGRAGRGLRASRHGRCIATAPICVGSRAPSFAAICLSPGRSLCPVNVNPRPSFARPAVRPAVGLRPLCRHLFAGCFPSINPPHPPPPPPHPPRARFLAVCASGCCPSSSSHPLPSRFRLSVLFPPVARPPPSPLLLLRCHTPYAHCRIVAMRHCRHPGPADDARHAVERVEGRQKAGGGRGGVYVGRAPRRTWPARSPRRHWQVAGPSGPGRHWTYRPPSLRGGGVQACAPRKPRPGPRSGVVVEHAPRSNSALHLRMLIEIVTRGVGEPAGGHWQARGASGGARTPQGDYFGSGRFWLGLLSTPVRAI